MGNALKEKECFRMLSVSGMLEKLANYGEAEVISTEEGIQLLMGVLKQFDMTFKLEETKDGYKILMKDSIWGHWRTTPEDIDSQLLEAYNEVVEMPRKMTKEELMEIGYDEEEADDLVQMQEDRLFIGAKVLLTFDHTTDELIDREMPFYIISEIEWEENLVRFKGTDGIAHFTEILPFPETNS